MAPEQNINSKVNYNMATLMRRKKGSIPEGRGCQLTFNPSSTGTSINKPDQSQIHNLLPCFDRYPSYNKPLGMTAG